MQAHHDLGGRSAGPIDRTERALDPWEKRVDAMLQLLSARERGIIRVDELRRAIEGLGAEEYDRLAYYERWMTAIAGLLLEKGVITTEELGRKLDEVRARERGARAHRGGVVNPRFAAGDRVAVRRSESPGHLRTPHYIRGRAGVVERVCGPYANPEELAYGRAGLPARPLYRVRFRQADVWPDYAGPPADCVEVELYEHWLEPA